eukprot:360633-Chlamydomonas_euryale.AAC.12
MWEEALVWGFHVRLINASGVALQRGRSRICGLGLPSRRRRRCGRTRRSSDQSVSARREWVGCSGMSSGQGRVLAYKYIYIYPSTHMYTLHVHIYLAPKHPSGPWPIDPALQAPPAAPHVPPAAPHAPPAAPHAPAGMLLCVGLLGGASTANTHTTNRDRNPETPTLCAGWHACSVLSGPRTRAP